MVPKNPVKSTKVSKTRPRRQQLVGGGDDDKVGLYRPSDKVVILTDKNFTGNKITSGFKGPGVLKAYAVWCVHCQNKVQDFIKLAKTFKAEKIGLVVYVIEANTNTQFATANDVNSFPTIMYVNDKCETNRLLSSEGNQVYDVPGAINALCSVQKKCLKKK